MNKLSLDSVSFLYGAGTPFEKKALQDVSVTFEEGKITGVIGHTGSGKSTMLDILCGLQRPTAGKVTLDGEDLYRSVSEIALEKMRERGFSDHGKFRLSLFHRSDWKKALTEAEEEKKKIRFRIGLVMQYPEYQLFDETVLDDICFGPRNKGFSDEDAKRSAREAAFTVGLTEEMLKKSPFDLSGGEKRRVAIAGILAMHPEILVLDEPAAGLDPAGRKCVFEAIARYNRESGATVILVSHSMEDLALYCDNAVVMKEGRLVGQGTVSDIFSDSSLLRDAGLQPPQIASIAAALLAEGIALRGDLYTVEGVEKAILARAEGRHNR